MRLSPRKEDRLSSLPTQNRFFAALQLLGALAVGCASLPKPTLEDVATAQRRFPAATLRSLEAGRRAFVDNCSGCHSLPRPEKESPSHWTDIMDEMAVEAKLSAAEKELVLQFVVTMSEGAADRQARR